MRADSTHCVHGTYIGYPGGADYMCGWCEDGISVREMREIHKAQEQRRMLAEAEIMNNVYDAIHNSEATEADKVKGWSHFAEHYRY